MTGALPRERSAFPPPRPRGGLSSHPPSARPVSLPPLMSASIRPAPAVVDVPAIPLDGSTPSGTAMPRRSSAGPVVLEAVRALASRRRVVPAAALVVLVALTLAGMLAFRAMAPSAHREPSGNARAARSVTCPDQPSPR